MRSPMRRAVSGFRTCAWGRIRSSAAERLFRRDPAAESDRRRGVRPSDRAGLEGVDERVGQRNCHRARSGAQPDRRDDLAGRGRQPAAQRPELSRHRAARARRVADQRRRHAAVCRNVGRARRRSFDRQPAQFLEQFHRRRPVGERRRGRTERHAVRRGCRRSVPGGHVGRTGRARTRARRLRERRDQERHERVARRPVRLLPRRCLQRPQCPVRHEAADVAAAVWRQPGRSDRQETGRSSS